VFVTKRLGLNRELPPGYESLAWVPNSSTLIYGERDAVLVDTFLTAEASQALADWVVASGKNLTAIYLPPFIEAPDSVMRSRLQVVVGDATIKTHVARIFSKLDLHDRAQAVVLAYESGLVQPGEATAQT